MRHSSILANWLLPKRFTFIQKVNFLKIHLEVKESDCGYKHTIKLTENSKRSLHSVPSRCVFRGFRYVKLDNYIDYVGWVREYSDFG